MILKSDCSKFLGLILLITSMYCGINFVFPFVYNYSFGTLIVKKVLLKLELKLLYKE
jgi:hypothetical protein